MAGDPNPTITYKGKKINVQEEFNKLSTDFAVKNKIETPTILLKPGILDASKFIDSFDDLSPEAQKFKQYS